MLLLLIAAGCTSGGDAPAPEIDETADRLRTLPYVNWSRITEDDRKRTGVTVHDAALAWRGVNLYNSRARSEARLIDMTGEPLWTWSSDVDQPPEQIPGLPAGSRWRQNLYGWETVELTGDGELTAIVKNHSILTLDRNSNVVRRVVLPAHHDFVVADDGDLYTLTYGKRTIDFEGRPAVILDNDVVVVSPHDEVTARVSVYDLMREFPPMARSLAARIPLYASHTLDEQRRIVKGTFPVDDPEAIEAVAQLYHRLYRDAIGGAAGEFDRFTLSALEGTAVDVLHTNSIAILDERFRGPGRPGDLLISIRELNTVAVIDMERRTLVWAGGWNELEAQHDASVLDNGNVLMFDNGVRSGRSRIVEISPQARQVVWQYEADPPSSFFSLRMGACQGLPNGNVLVAESARGRVFEITRAGRVVWEYFNPDVVGARRSVIYKMTRYDEDVVERIRAR